MLDTGHDLPLRGPVRAQLVSDHDTWRRSLLLEKFSHQPLGRLCIAATLHQHIKHETILIDRAPQPVLLATDCDDNFVEVPLAIKLTSRSAADVTGIPTTEFLHPHTDSLM